MGITNKVERSDVVAQSLRKLSRRMGVEGEKEEGAHAREHAVQCPRHRYVSVMRQGGWRERKGGRGGGRKREGEREREGEGVRERERDGERGSEGWRET